MGMLYWEDIDMIPSLQLISTRTLRRISSMKFMNTERQIYRIQASK